MNLRKTIQEMSDEELNESSSSFLRKIVSAYNAGKEKGTETADLVDQGYSVASAREIIKIINFLEKASKSMEKIEKRTAEENR